MKQRLPESEIERIAAERRGDALLALLREICPQFLMRARHLHVREEEVLVSVVEILEVAKGDSKERATAYFEALYERLFYDWQCCSPSVPEEEIHVVVSLIAYLAAALLFFYDGEKSAVLMHRYADDISISAARYASFHKDMREKLFARLDPKADVLEQIVCRYINGRRGDGFQDDPQMTEKRIKEGIDVLVEEMLIKYAYDYHVIKVLLEQKYLMTFNNGQRFVDYLKRIGVSFKLPDADSINLKISDMSGHYPEWIWKKADRTEAIRRINIAKRFDKIYGR